MGTSTYTVQPGDTLSTIAATKLGSTARWTEIYNLNKAIIPNPNVISQGLVLTLPAGATLTPASSSSGSFFAQNKMLIFGGVAAVIGLSFLPILLKKKKGASLQGSAASI